MDSSKLGNWLQIVGNLGLIAGLILVALQIQQNTELTRAQIIHEAWIANMNMWQSLAGDNPATALAKARAAKPLTDEDLEILDAVLTARAADVARGQQMQIFGFTLLSDESRGENFARYYLGNPAAQAWFELRGTGSGIRRTNGLFV